MSNNQSSDIKLISLLRHALRHLYDPAELAKNSLAKSPITGNGTGQSALRKSLTDAIVDLKPKTGMSLQSDVWRTYNTLYQRYVEQFTQAQVAASLGLSERQLRRQENLALYTLADYLTAHYSLSEVIGHASLDRLVPDLTSPKNIITPDYQDELDLLATLPNEAVDTREVIAAVLKTVELLMVSLQVHTCCDIPNKLPPVYVQVSNLRQALLNIMTATINCIPGGTIYIGVGVVPHHIYINVRPVKQGLLDGITLDDVKENLKMARELAEISQMHLDILPGDEKTVPFTARLDLPVEEATTIVVVEDNKDAHVLFQHYLSGTNYVCQCISESEKVLPTVEKISPRIIILDVMLPGIDGWELLGRLREHPKTRHIPVIICTILPQSQLAFSLGAKGFLRKPFTREELLSALNLVTEKMEKEPN